MSSERLDAFYIREVERDGTKESFWNRIGSAWINRDGSINVKLFLTPPDGKIHLRKPKVKPEEKQEGPYAGPPVDFGGES